MSIEVKPDFWINRWKNKDTPWHLADPEPLMLRHFPKRPSQNILVPLCGKSVDMLWFQKQGHTVVGIELSELACRSFFSDAKIEFKTKSVGPFEVYEAERIKIWCGDFFEIQEKDLPPLDLIYDRAALIALPPDLRTKYAQRIAAIAKVRASKNFEMLVILREGIDETEQGPPFHVSADDLRATYSSTFDIAILETMTRPSRGDPHIQIVDSAYRLVLK